DRLVGARTGKGVMNSLNAVGSPVGSPGVPSEVSPTSTSAPRSLGSVIGGKIARYILKEDETAGPPPAPEPSPMMAAMLPGRYWGKSGPELIPNEEFPVGLIDPVTENWRRGIEAANRPRVSGVDEVNPLDPAAVDRALVRQHLRVIK